MAVEIDVRYLGELHCEAVHRPSHSTLLTDAPTDNGGKGEAFSPTDLVATGLGTCLLTMVGIVARRRTLDLRGAQVHVVKEMTAAPDRRIGRLTATLTMPAGLALDDESRALLERSARTCPVKQSLHPDTAVEIEFVYPD
jgi:putative redox protein